MSRRPNVSQTLAMKAAAAAAREVEQDDADADFATASQAEAVLTPQAAPPAQDPQPAETEERAKAVGRPKGRRPVAARQTVYLDDARHAALARIAEDRGRSIHSLILEGIDHVIGKPTAKGWQ
ncbi:hypothetical protein MKK63_23955 [Methylobacterium sp. J-088]|uniref:hypothetical protein n=1 Tax=Methylobacterium sp. J-088 TaxID=2836664 RepID=UPI001FB9000B|nr:hypothetical protein [Methylobacterium sp. J-088]MCJ2065733.1 hypothetical protein [Methylobacterium sp. J-088]